MSWIKPRTLVVILLIVIIGYVLHGESIDKAVSNFVD